MNGCLWTKAVLLSWNVRRFDGVMMFQEDPASHVCVQTLKSASGRRLRPLSESTTERNTGREREERQAEEVTAEGA